MKMLNITHFNKKLQVVDEVDNFSATALYSKQSVSLRKGFPLRKAFKKPRS